VTWSEVCRGADLGIRINDLHAHAGRRDVTEPDPHPIYTELANELRTLEVSGESVLATEPVDRADQPAST
jgi:hypothetical protein